jgi:hypothetical protein
MLGLMGKLIPFAHLLARRFLRDTAGMSWASRMRILDVLQKANRARIARETTAAVIEKAREEITYPVLECKVGMAPAPPDEVPPGYGAGLFPDVGQREFDLLPSPKPILRLVDRPPQ